MSRVAGSLLFVALIAVPLPAADLPSGAVARLGDPAFRAGGPVSHLALSPDGNRFVTARPGADGVVLVAVWDSASGQPLRHQAVPADRFDGLSWGTDGLDLVARGDSGADTADGLRLWAVSAPKPDMAITYTAVRAAADGSRVAARCEVGGKHAVHLFERGPNGVARCGTLDLGAEGADEFLLAADGRTAVTFRKLEAGDREEPVDLYAATAWDAGGRPSKPVPVRAARGGRLMLTPDARALVLFVVEGSEWGFDRFDLTTRSTRKLARWPGAAPADRGGFAFAPAGDVLAVAVGARTIVLNYSSGKELGRLEGHAGTVRAVAFSADGATIGTADEFGLVRLWNAKGLTARSPAHGHRAQVRHAELSPDGRRVLTWAEDRTARLWDLGTGRELRAFANVPRAPALAADGTALVYDTADGPVARDLLTGLEIELTDRPGPGRALAPVAPDGRQSAEGRPNGVVVLVEAATGRARRALVGHRGPAAVLGFTPDGAKLLTTCADHTVLVWDIRPQGVPLPDALKKETSAARLWEALAGKDTEAAYLAMARLSREPDAVVKMARLRVRPAAEGDPEPDPVADARALELLSAVGTPDARALLKELAEGHPGAARTRAAQLTLERPRDARYDRVEK